MALTAKQKLVWDILRTDINNIDFVDFRKQHKRAWLTKERKIILMSNMETEHIISCINMLESLGQTDTVSYQGLIEEVERRDYK